MHGHCVIADTIGSRLNKLCIDCCTSLSAAGFFFTIASVYLLDLDQFLSWKAWAADRQKDRSILRGDCEEDALLPAEKREGDSSAGQETLDDMTFYEGWGSAVRVSSGWLEAAGGILDDYTLNMSMNA